MSNDFIKEFLIGVGFSTDQASLGKFTGGLAMATVAVTAVNKIIMVAESAIKGLVNSVPELAAQYREMAKDAQNAGVSIGELNRLREMAPFLESSAEAVSGSLRSIASAAGMAYMGIGRQKVIFEKLGISVKDANGKLKSSAVIMREVGEAMKGKERGEQKAVFERLGIDPTMIKALTTDVSGLTAEFDALADGIDLEKAAKESKELGININWLKYVTGKTREAFLSQFIGPVGKGIKWVADQAKKYMPVIIEKMKPVVAWGVRIGTAIAAVGKVWIEAGIKIIKFLSDINDKTKGWAAAITIVIAAWKLLNLSFATSPIGIILELSAALALLYDDYKGFKEGKDSLIDWKELNPNIEWFIEKLNNIRLFLEDITAGLAFLASLGFSAAKGDVRGMKEQMKWAKGEEGKKYQLPSEIYTDKENLANAPKNATEANAWLDRLQPEMSFGPGGAGQTVNQNTTINVNGVGDPAAVGGAVRREQTRVNKDMTRNLKPVAQ
jgi:hypothetical protein